MTREERLENLLGNLELAGVNLLRRPRDEGARAQLRDVLDAVAAFRRLDAAQAAADRHPLPVTATALLAPERPASPVHEAELSGRAGYKEPADA